jgi:hypothetical protein
VTATTEGVQACVPLDGLAMPESPRWRDGCLWFSNCGTCQIVAVDLDGNSDSRVNDLATMEGAIPPEAVAGERYDARQMATLDSENGRA